MHAVFIRNCADNPRRLIYPRTFLAVCYTLYVSDNISHIACRSSADIGGLNPAGDVRDIVADVKRVADGEKGSWIKLGGEGYRRSSE